MWTPSSPRAALIRLGLLNCAALALLCPTPPSRRRRALRHDVEAIGARIAEDARLDGAKEGPR